MTVVDRIRQINAEHDMLCAELEIIDPVDGTPDVTTVCFSILDLPFITVRRARIAWKLGKCPLCFWALVRSFGLTEQETAS